MHETGSDESGNVLPSGMVFVTRDDNQGALWTLQIGFTNWSEFDQSIEWGVHGGQFPPMALPVQLSWHGFNRWGKRENEHVSVPPIQLRRDGVAWFGRDWTNVADVDAEWIVSTLVENALLQPQPAAAAMRLRQSVPAGRWEEVRRIASWRPAEVWEVRDTTEPGTPHRAMKMLRTRKGPGTTAYKRIIREIETTQRLSAVNDGIVPVLDFGIPADGELWRPYYVMPLAEGTLAKGAQSFQGNLEGVLRLGVKLAAALVAAHDERVIHRDVKPDNILLLGDERRPVIADFGICFLASEEADRITAAEAGTVGAADYVAPELLGGKATPTDLDGRVDIYSLGKTLYYALSGGTVFPREYFAQDRYDLRRRMDDPRLEHFYGLLERMVVEEPARRFSSMRECREQLNRALDNIKRGIPYVEGMYGGSYSPVEVMERLARQLREVSGVQREDMIRDAIESAVGRLHSMATPLDDTRPLAGSQELMMRTAYTGAEHLLAVGVCFVVNDDSDWLERWLDEVTGLAYDEHSAGVRPTRTCRAAAVLALHGVAVAALIKERFHLVRVVIERYLKRPEPFIHLAMFGDKASRSWNWLAGCVRESQVLMKWQPTTAGNVDERLYEFAGLVLLTYLLRLDAEELSSLIPESGNVDIPVFPGLLPDACTWIETLPSGLMKSRSRERRVAQELFGTSTDSLRMSCAALTPKLRRVLGWTAGQLNRRSQWIGGIPQEGAWAEWTGAGTSR